MCCVNSPKNLLSIQVFGSGGSDPKLQSKTVNSSFVYQQSVSADNGYEGLSNVQIMPNTYGYTRYTFKNITFTYDNSSYYSAVLNLSEGTQETSSNLFHYNWTSDYLLILQKICGISVFVSFPSSPIKSGILMTSGVVCGLYNKYSTGELQPIGTYTYYPLYNSSFTSITNVMSIIYAGQLNSNGITLKFNSSSIYNYWYYNTIVASTVEMMLYI